MEKNGFCQKEAGLVFWFKPQEGGINSPLKIKYGIYNSQNHLWHKGGKSYIVRMLVLSTSPYCKEEEATGWSDGIDNSWV